MGVKIKATGDSNLVTALDVTMLIKWDLLMKNSHHQQLPLEC